MFQAPVACLLQEEPNDRNVLHLWRDLQSPPVGHFSRLHSPNLGFFHTLTTPVLWFFPALFLVKLFTFAQTQTYTVLPTPQ
jgi:hypothetical protein